MIYLVTGFMRSGTSMMMQALEAGGLEVAKSEERDMFNELHSGGRYKPNPVGLYELSTREKNNADFPRMYDGKALKCIALFLSKLAVHEYKVIFMRRDAEEIRQSYEAAFGQKIDNKTIEKRVEESLKTLHNRKDVLEIHEIWYDDILENPKKFLTSLNWPIDVERASKVIDKGLKRFKKEILTQGA